MESSGKGKGPRRKRRVIQHIMEESSRQIIRETLPSHWAVHDFDKPDYGIDLVIEVFEKVDDSFETLGEYLYIQVKSEMSVKIEQIKVHPVDNVSRQAWIEDKSRWMAIDVVKFPIETDLLYTVQMLGTSVSVLLFVVDLSTRRTYFLCLNDYIEKYLLPAHPGFLLPAHRGFLDQQTVTLYIPTANVLGNGRSETALSFYSKRAKFLAFSSKFHYQRNELGYLFAQSCWSVASSAEFEGTDAAVFAGAISVVLYFIEQIEHLDIWEFKAWPLMPVTKEQIVDLRDFLSRGPEQLSRDVSYVKSQIDNLWFRLANINNIFEELTREQHLPKYLSLLMRPDMPPEQFA
jgi:hypothetical protein